MADRDVSEHIAAMKSRADSAALMGRDHLAGAYSACAVMLLDAALEDGVELDTELLGDAFGVAYDC
ncbi:hypothetical protein CH75_09180 [Dyella jiangningensis]|nr:hypothetical protein CH75_09180 [Dyella jiangningensis]